MPHFLKLLKYKGGTPMLSIQHLTKVYKGGKKAVDDLSLEINAGDIFGFIGHNGAGKTTTIKCATGILDFSDGEIFVDGISIKEDPIACKKRIAYVPDNPEIYENLTGIQYLNFIADIYEVPKEVRNQRMKEYGDTFELTSDMGSQISSYSHGMKQKLVLISALLHDPKLLILDEPFVGLDPKASFTLKEMMRQMCQRGCAIFFSTHVLEVAEKFCTNIAIIKAGKVIVNGKTQDIVGDKSLEELFLGLLEE